MITSGINHKTSVTSPPDKQLRLKVDYFTDPLCCWSWAFEPQWRRLRYEFSEVITWKNRMAGLLPGWQNYNDALLTVSRPVQMGPIWKEAAGTSGMPVDEHIWVENVPASSFPSCFAVKTAQLQGEEIGDIYLRNLREAVMLHKKDISKSHVLFEIARETADLHPSLFDFDTFSNDFYNKKGLQNFQKDLDDRTLKGIDRFPTLFVTAEGHRKSIIITGYRPYEELIKTLLQYFPSLPAPQHQPDKGDFIKHWNSPFPREIEELEPSVISLFNT